MPSLRQIRLASGLVLFIYVTPHFINHALGNISVARDGSGLASRNGSGSRRRARDPLPVAPYPHGLGFWALYPRRHFRWTRLEATQLVLGLSIPFLLADHVIGSRVSFSQFGTRERLRAGTAQVLGPLARPAAPAGDHAADRVDLRLSRTAFLAAAEAVLSAGRGSSCCRSRCCCRRSPCSASFRAAGRCEAVDDPAWRALHITPDRIGRGPERGWRRSHLVLRLR